jgi:hypothetical protein
MRVSGRGELLLLLLDLEEPGADVLGVGVEVVNRAAFGRLVQYLVHHGAAVATVTPAAAGGRGEAAARVHGRRLAAHVSLLDVLLQQQVRLACCRCCCCCRRCARSAR